MSKKADTVVLPCSCLELIRSRTNANKHRAMEQAQDSKNRIWLHGIEGMTKDPEGFVYWKGIKVEQFLCFTDADAERVLALSLAKICNALVAKGFPVNERTVMVPMFLEAPADTPWLDLMLNLHGVFYRGAMVKLVLAKPDGKVVILPKAENGERLELSTKRRSAVNVACQALKKSGYISKPLFSYEELLDVIKQIGITPPGV